MVRFSRPGLVEEYTVSADGVRQDFLVATPPPDAGDLRVTLAASGARVEATPFGARLVLEGSGRKIAYSRLRVTDATGRELPARFDVTAPGHNAGDDGREDGGALPTRRCGELAILVNDANAVYPIRIDPTFSDENWISIIPSVPGVGGEVYAAAMDTAGNLYIGGSFISAGSVVANRIAKWDGSSWSALGSGMNNRVWALAVSGSDLYAGGYFTTAGGVSANCVARWNGSSWSALGSGMGGLVYALAVSGSDLYAGGTFTTAGGVAANRIAKWDGSDWSALGSGMNDWVGALAVSGSDLYAGGGFGTAGGVSAQNIAKWNGSSWSPLGSGMNDCVRALAVSGSDLYVGGDFSTAGGVSANYVAKWDGSSWSPLGTGMNDWVGALAVSGSDLYAGGTFTTAGGVEANRIAKWNGSSWSALGLGMVGGVYALAVSGSDLYVGGNFTKVGGVSANYVAKWNGSSWSALGSGMNGGVSALAVSGNDLYAGGSFTMAGGVEANRIAKWNGSSWSMLGSGMDGPVYSLAVSGSDLYAGGYFRTAGGVAANRVAKWNGSGWSALGWGLDSYVSALVVSGDDLYAGGGFWGRVSRWDGSSWTALGSGVDGYVYALAVSGSDLYAGGNFTAAGGVSAKYIARWDGSSWTALGSGVDGYVYALAVSGTDLYAGGWFTTAGGVAANYVAKWDGSIWNDLGSGMNYIVSALAVAGSDLYAGGDFTTAGGVSANYVAKWNGSSWNALGSGMNGTVRALAVSGSDLYAGGTFSLAGGKVSAYVAKADLSAPSVSFDDNSDVLTNPWLGLYQVGDSYSFAGTGSFAGATRSYSIIGRETVLGVKCLVLHVVGQGTGAEATQYTTVRVAQDTVGNLQVLKITGTESGGEVISWTADAVSQAALLIPSVPQAGQSWLWPEGGRHEVVALNQTVPQLSTGLGPYSNCVQLRRGTDDSWLASGVGVVKEVWNDDGQLNGWERTTSSSVVFDANSDVFTNPWLGLYQVGDSYSFAGTGTFTGATRTWSIIGQETVLGVKCLVLRIHGHGKGSYANEYYDVRVAQDTNGNLRFLRVTGWEPAGGALDSTVSTPASARMLFPATVQVGQRWLMFDQQSDVMAVGQTVPQLSTGFGPTPNCVHVRAVSNDGDVDESWWGAGVGVVKEVWNDSGQLNGWERITSSSVVFDANSDVFTNPWLGLYQVGDSYSLAGTGTFAGASRSWSIIGRETVLGVKCLVLRVLGHGTGANANEYYDVRLAQDTQGDLRALKVAGWKPSGPIETWTAASPAQAVLWYPMNFQVGQMWTWFEEQHQVLALSQTLPQLSTGFGPTSNCVHVRTTYDGGADVDEFWLAPGVGSVKEAWNDSGQLNGWERVPDFGFASWTVQTGLPGDRRGPTDRNGPLDLPNLLAYALGVNPMTAQPEDLPTGSLHDAGGQEQFHFIYRKSKTAMGIEMRVVGALSLEAADWQPVTATPVKVGDTPDGLAELWQVTIPVDVPQRFLRLAVLPRGVSPAPAGMVLIPTGTFTMGDTFNEGESRERPVHSVYVSAFYMDKFAVTEALWDEVRVWANANGYDLGTVGAGRAADHPVHSVNWYDAVKWCNARSEREGRIPAYYTSAGQTTVYQSGQVDVQNDWVKWDAGYRLPTDAEWEKAARGGLEGNRFPWGDTIQHSRANYNSTMSYTYDTSPTRGYHPTFATGGEPYTSPVGYFAPNGYGLYDMAGNVWEWCWDWYSTSYYGVSPAADPRGPTSGSIRVERGGCWGDGTGALFSRCASRSGRIVLYRGHFLGFRSVLGSGQP